MIQGNTISTLKKAIYAICDNVDEPGGVVLSEISQTQKDKCHLITFVTESEKVTLTGRRLEQWRWGSQGVEENGGRAEPR